MTWLIWPVHRGQLLEDDECGLLYSETLWMLRDWLVRGYPECQSLGDRPALFDRQSMPILGKWPPEILAYMLMRHRVESASTWGLCVPTGVPSIASKTLIVLRRYDNRWNLNAESVQAMTLGRFAAYYWWVKSGCPRSNRAFHDDRPTVACWETQRPWDASMAAIVFPPIPSMPLGRFDPSPVRLKDAVELVRGDVLSRRRLAQSSRRGESDDAFDPSRWLYGE